MKWQDKKEIAETVIKFCENKKAMEAILALNGIDFKKVYVEVIAAKERPPHPTQEGQVSIRFIQRTGNEETSCVSRKAVKTIKRNIQKKRDYTLEQSRRHFAHICGTCNMRYGLHYSDLCVSRKSFFVKTEKYQTGEIFIFFHE